MKTPAPKKNSTLSKSSQPPFNKKEEGSFFSTLKVGEQSFFSPNLVIQRNLAISSFSGGNNFANIPNALPTSEPVVQPKLTINEPGDKYEQEADAMADRVMRMPQTPLKEDEKQLQRKEVPGGSAWGSESIIIQRKCAGCEEKEKVQRQEMEEEKPLQTKPLMRKAEGGGYTASPQFSSQLNSSKGGGDPLPAKTLASMNQAFGADFARVRIHTDGQAVEMSEGIQASAFTHGADIYFNQGKYNPNTKDGNKLLAHELTHTIQQGSANQLRRKIEVSGSNYVPTSKYLTWLKGNYGQTAVDLVKMMHNAGKLPVHKFDSFEALGYEVRVRNQAIKGMDKVHEGCCSYPSHLNPNGYLNPTYWVRNGWMNFKTKSPFPAGKKASDAINAIFAPGAGTELECLTMTIAIEYYSLLKGLGEAKFNKMFSGGAGLEINVSSGLGVVGTPKYKFIKATKADLLTGDWVYFKNFTDYLTKHPNGFWQGENAIVMGPDKFRGFGVSNLSEDDMNKELVKVYNDGLPLASKKTKANLLAQGGGLQSYPVIRPVIKEILK